MNNTVGQIVNPWAIDSLKIRIPLNRVAVLDESIREIVARVSTRTGEVLEEQQNRKSSRDEHGIKTEFSIEQRATKFETVTYLVILVNAKQLKERYFEGITTNTVADLHGYLMKLEVVKFSLKEFLKGECTDIDFRKDIEARDDVMKEALNHLHQNAKPSTDYDKGSKLFWQKDNKGLQFNKRATTKIKTAPFLKIYSKSLDLLHKSNIFALAHFDTIPPNLWRLEFTIKNKKHLASFNHGNTFADVLSLSTEQIEEMCTSSLKAILNGGKRTEPKETDGIPPRDVYEVNSLILHLDSGIQWHTIKERLLGSLSGSNRSKRLKRMEELYQSYIRPIERYNSHFEVDTLLKQIGYNF